MRLLVVNWQDRENPLAGGAEIHLHEIFGRLTSSGFDVTLLCGGWPGAPPAAELDGIHVHRVGTRYTFPFVARRAYRDLVAREHFDLVVEDINKVPLYTPRWVGGTGTPVVALIPHLFGDTVFQEAPLPLAALVWAMERPIRIIFGVWWKSISIAGIAECPVVFWCIEGKLFVVSQFGTRKSHSYICCEWIYCAIISCTKISPLIAPGGSGTPLLAEVDAADSGKSDR